MYKYSRGKYSEFSKDKVNAARMSYQGASCHTGTSIKVMLPVTKILGDFSSSQFNIILRELWNNCTLQTNPLLAYHFWNILLEYL
jgi:hypothetical protein